MPIGALSPLRPAFGPPSARRRAEGGPRAVEPVTKAAPKSEWTASYVELPGLYRAALMVQIMAQAEAEAGAPLAAPKPGPYAPEPSLMGLLRSVRA